MGRRPAYKPLRVYLNNRLVGSLVREASGAIGFSYNDEWLDWEHASPVSLSLPLREMSYRGEPVAAVFENLLPDSDKLRRLVAEKVGARGTDAYSMLNKIGHDCVGALQFISEDEDAPDTTGTLKGEPVDDATIERLLKGLSQPALSARQIERKQMKMAMSDGDSRHYRFDQIHGRHFVQTAMRAGLSEKRAKAIVEEIESQAPKAMEAAAQALPGDFPAEVVDVVSKAARERLRGLQITRSYE